MAKQYVVGISGASGAIYGVRLLEALKKQGVHTHLVVSKWGMENIRLELGETSLASLADELHDVDQLGASIASGSFLYDGMFIVPASMKTCASIAHGFSDNLIARAADVCLKEGRPLVLSPRETPLSTIHLENLLKLAQAGARIVPPMPGFYNHPTSLDDVINHHVMKLLDQMGLHTRNEHRYTGEK